jgi:hypothetical protein
MPDRDTHTVKGPGLARGPALIIGTVLAVFGLILFLHDGATATGGFPDADVNGRTFLGFEANGWTAFITTAAGVALLFGAAQHLLAKTMSLIVGVVLAACAVLALVNGPGVLGLAAANWATELGWGIAAVLLLLNLFAPRIKKEEPLDRERALARRRDHGDHADHPRATTDHDRDRDGRASGLAHDPRGDHDRTGDQGSLGDRTPGHDAGTAGTTRTAGGDAAGTKDGATRADR